MVKKIHFSVWLNGELGQIWVPSDFLKKLKEIAKSVQKLYGRPFSVGRLYNFIFNHWYYLPRDKALEAFLSLSPQEQAAMLRGVFDVIRAAGPNEEIVFVGTHKALQRHTGITLYHRGWDANNPPTAAYKSLYGHM